MSAQRTPLEQSRLRPVDPGQKVDQNSDSWPVKGKPDSVITARQGKAKQASTKLYMI
jgi:hypothetical protein